MNKEWVEEREAENKSAIAQKRKDILSKIEETELLSSEQKKEVLESFSKIEHDSHPFNKIDLQLHLFAILADNEELREKIMSLRKELAVDKYIGMLNMRGGYNRYLDSEPVDFDGDIIITDPCYICKKQDTSTMPTRSDFGDHESYSAALDKWYDENPRHWNLCECGYNMEVFGIKNYMTRDTMYGDWGCTTYNSDTKEKIGQFCADAGLVSVFLLDEVLQYNSDFDYHINRPWTTTLIKNFKGAVQFVVEREEGFYEEDTEWWTAGDKWVEYAVKVVGRGVNKVTGEPINFITSQSSL